MFLKELIHIAELDFEFIEAHHAVIADVIDYSNLKELPLGQIDANAILWEIFYCINTEVFTRIKNQIENDELTLPNDEVKDRLLNVCEMRMEGFSPFINCIDSWFQNELDNITIKDRKLPDIAADVIPFLIENT